MKSLTGLLSGEALTLPYYRNRKMHAWVRETVQREGIRRAVAFSSPMAQYLDDLDVRSVVDLVDVDSAKWTSYASEHRWPLSAIYRREGKRLLAFERAAVARASAGVLVTRAEVELFNRLAPECAGRMHAIENGVDSDYFAPSENFSSPFKVGEAPLVFTGVMDYWPNVDAVTWFAREVLPAVAHKRPDVRFYVVGMNPVPAVLALAADARVIVTGKVSDVRPYLQHASAIVAPLRIARGVQNKVLEAMAMARPVVVSAAAGAGISGSAGVEFEAADDAVGFAQSTLSVLDPGYGNAMGERARACIRVDYRWEVNLARFADLIDGASAQEATGDGHQAALDVALAG